MEFVGFIIIFLIPYILCTFLTVSYLGKSKKNWLVLGGIGVNIAVLIFPFFDTTGGFIAMLIAWPLSIVISSMLAITIRYIEWSKN